jgi:hypothetical protein
MKSPARLVVGVALSLLLCSLLQCAAGQGAEAEEMMRLPINFGDGNAPQTLEVAMRQLRSPGPIAVATAFLRGKGFGERKEFPELVSALAQLLVSRYNEIADARSEQAQSAQSSQRRVLAEVPITLGNGQEVTMVHYESSTAVDTVVSFCKAAGITEEAVAQQLLAALQKKLQAMDGSASQKQEAIALPIDFGNGRVVQFLYNPQVHKSVEVAVSAFLQQNGIRPGSDVFSNFASILVQQITERLAAQAKSAVRQAASAQQAKAAPSADGEVVLDLVINNESSRLSIPNSMDSIRAASDFATQVGLAGTERFEEVVRVVANQIELRRKAVTGGQEKTASSDAAVEKVAQNAVPLFELPVKIDDRDFGSLKFFSWQRPKDCARRFVRDFKELNESPKAMAIVNQLTVSIERRLQALGSRAPAPPVPLVTFPVSVPGIDQRVMFEYMTGRDPYESTIDFLEETGQAGHPDIDSMIKVLERGVRTEVVNAAKRYESENSKLFEVPFSIGKMQAPISIHYQQPPLLAANAFCLQHADAVYQSKSSIALCTDTIVEILLRILDQVQASGILNRRK